METQPATAKATPWTVEAKTPNIHVVTWDVNCPPSQFEAWVLLRGDAHHDNPHSDHAMERRHLDQVVLRNGLWLDVGDLFCAMGGKYDPRSMKRGITRPEHQVANDYLDSIVNHAADFYSPYAGHCICLGRGNHERSILKRHETDLTDRLVQLLRYKTGHPISAGGYGGWVHFVFQYYSTRSPLRLKYFHGSGGGGMMSFDTLRVRRQSSFTPDADVIACGHVHESWWLKISRERLRTERGVYRVEIDDQHHVRTGTYKDEYGDGEGGWHVESGKPPKSVGAVWMRIRLGLGRNGSYDRPIVDFQEAR